MAKTRPSKPKGRLSKGKDIPTTADNRNRPWPPGDATDRIRQYANSDPELQWTDHVMERMEERDLTIGDALHVLKRGFVYEEAETASRGFFRYKMECTTPNSNGRTVAIVVIPSMQKSALKIVTIMWADEN